MRLNDGTVNQMFSIALIRPHITYNWHYLQYAWGLQQLSATRARINIDEEVINVTNNDAQQVKYRARLDMQ